MSSAGADIDTHLVDVLLPQLYPHAVITRGATGHYTDSDVAAVMSTTVAAAQECMGPRRRITEDMSVTLVLAAARAGDIAAQKKADEAAWAMLTALRDHLRAATTPNLDGAAIEARVAAYELTRGDDPEVLDASVRTATMTVTLAVRARN